MIDYEKWNTASRDTKLAMVIFELLETLVMLCLYQGLRAKASSLKRLSATLKAELTDEEAQNNA